eukprot:TRINITY_DN12350_c0_g1_i1.p1 TRINITY_DN12350_c0_g1~~TRINITY_DN12350_c0_g1_i1.p1  ORF type:complete len:196 (-),score=36.49 TRINITY_DN12350_c0_g1_i1:125-712(-)
MSSLKFQKRLAADVLGCGKRKIWIDPNETSEVSLANSRKDIKKLIDGMLIMKLPPIMHSRARARRRMVAKRKGRHTGKGKRRGTRNARMPVKKLWMDRQRVLRRLLRKYRAADKIDRHFYHDCYVKSKGNVFKNKTVLIEYIHKEKNEKKRLDGLKAQAEARRLKNRALRKKRAERAAAKLQNLSEGKPVENDSQ